MFSCFVSVLISSCYSAASPEAETERRALYSQEEKVARRTFGNIEMFPLLLQVQNQTGYKEIILLIISHLESLVENLRQ